METLIIRSNSKKAIRLIQELSKEMGAQSKKLTNQEMEDFAIGQSIKKGLKSGTSSRERVIKALQS
jgi:hypothetical protein